MHSHFIKFQTDGSLLLTSQRLLFLSNDWETEYLALPPVKISNITLGSIRGIFRKRSAIRINYTDKAHRDKNLTVYLTKDQQERNVNSMQYFYEQLNDWEKRSSQVTNSL